MFDQQQSKYDEHDNKNLVFARRSVFAIRRIYSVNGGRKFDVELMSRVYERPFEFVVTDAKFMSVEKEMNVALGGNLIRL